MSGDKRTVATDALEYVGTILGPEVKRDAVHFAVEPVEAGEHGLRAGDRIGRLFDGTFGRAVPTENYLGIVDPFLRWEIAKGDRFFLFIEPGTIRSLRHVWEHPDFDSGVAHPVSTPVAARIPSHVPLAPLTGPFVPGQLDPEAQRRKESRQWIENYALGFGTDYNGASVSYDELIQGARDYVRYGNRLSLGGLFEGECTSEEFWHHWEVVTGERAGEDYGDNFFSCSC
jgi:hypothetical protein